MKLVKETLFEKFTEDSDPIDDMGIGIKNQLEKFMDSIKPSITLRPGEEKTLDHMLITCVFHKKIEFIEYLLLSGANVEAYNSLPLKTATKSGDIEMVKLLLKHGANPSSQGNHSIIQAKSKGYDEIYKLLKRAQAKFITRK